MMLQMQQLNKLHKVKKVDGTTNKAEEVTQVAILKICHKRY
jgi:hypothetical protein